MRGGTLEKKTRKHALDQEEKKSLYLGRESFSFLFFLLSCIQILTSDETPMEMFEMEYDTDLEEVKDQLFRTSWTCTPLKRW